VQQQNTATEPNSAASSAWRALVGIVVLLVLFGAALPLDIPVSTWVHNIGMTTWMNAPAHYVLVHDVLRFYGIFTFTVFASVVLLLLDLLRGHRRWPQLGKNSAIVFLSGIFSGVNAILKWCVGRERPYHNYPAFEFHPFNGGIKGLFNAEMSLSFPSGDVSLAFAMAASLSMAAPKWWPLWWGLGIWIALERIAQGAHYPSDTIGGAAVGIASALVARMIIERAFGRPKEQIADGK
jgi:membrane-associated phospholipid phosphatase